MGSAVGPGMNEFEHVTQFLQASVVQFVKWKILPILTRLELKWNSDRFGVDCSETVDV